MNDRQCSFSIIKLASRNIHDFTKVLSQNKYFGTEFTKVFATSYTVSKAQHSTKELIE